MAGDTAAKVWSGVRSFADLSPEALAALAASAMPIEVRRGEALVQQGEAADALYLVVSGRFHVLRDGEPAPIAEIGAGEPVGELAFFAGGPRTATVRAARDSEVLRLTREAYEAVAARAPAVPRAILKAVSRRLAAVSRAAPTRPQPPPKVIAVCPAGAAPLPPGCVEGLAAALRRFGRVATLAQADAPSDLAAGSDGAIVQWLQAQERRFDIVLHDLGGCDEAWGRATLRNADAALLIGRLAEARGGPVPLSAREAYALELFRPADCILVLWRNEARERICGTAHWLDRREIALHHHVALDAPGDLERLARFLTGRALGAVFSGAAAFGCAHVGAVRALREAGAEMDMFGGTSSGAALAAAFAMGLDPDEAMERIEAMFVRGKALRRLMIPLHSLLDHRVFDALLREQLGATAIEDMPFNCFAVSTDLATDAMRVHRRGPLWEAVRGSGAIPGILPPLVTPDGGILVDGALVDNVPVRVMRALKAGPNVVVTVAEDDGDRLEADYGALPSRLGLARDLVLRRRRPFPGIVNVLTRSMLVASRQALRNTRFEEDALFTVPTLPGMGVLDWRRGREQAALAYDHVRHRIEEAGGLDRLFGRAGGAAPAG